MTRVEKWGKWSALVSEQMASGKNMAEWCREKKIGYSLFLYWKNQIIRRKTSKYPISLDFGNGLRLDVSKGFDEEALCRIILALQNLLPEVRIRSILGDERCLNQVDIQLHSDPSLSANGFRGNGRFWDQVLSP